MTTTSRKQREIQKRELQILTAAKQLLLQCGYHGLSMDRIAQQLEYAKGTIYNHFSCKEEIILQLANTALEKRSEMFCSAARFKGLTRERLTAISAADELFYRVYPDHFAVEQLLRSSSVWDKTSQERQEIMQRCESRCLTIVGEVVRDAVACGDLKLEMGMTPEYVAFGLWSMSFGAYRILATSQTLRDTKIDDPHAVVRTNLNALVDGFGWLPLARDIDFDALYDRIRAESLAEAFSELEQQQSKRNGLQQARENQIRQSSKL